MKANIYIFLFTSKQSRQKDQLKAKQSELAAKQNELTRQQRKSQRQNYL